MNILTIKRLLAWVFTPLLALAILSQATFAAPIKVVVPNRLDGVEGEESINVSNVDSFRQQQLNLASEFTSLPETHRSITGFYSRPDYTVTQPSSATYDDLVIKVSTTPVSGLASVFADNYGSEVMTVYEGPLTISTQATGEPAGPRGFDYYFPFNTPYSYDPDAGNLLVELVSDSGPAGSLILDGFSGVQAVYVSALGSNPTTGTVQNGGFVNQFEFVQVSPADFNLDFTVNDADLALWEGGYGSPGSRENGDADGNGLVNGLDFLIWQREFVSGVHGLAAELGVPEPSSILLATLCVVGLGAHRIRRCA